MTHHHYRHPGSHRFPGESRGPAVVGAHTRLRPFPYHRWAPAFAGEAEGRKRT